MKTFKQSIIAVVVGLAMVAGISWAANWTGPTANPPGANKDAPIHVGTENQGKLGGITIGAAANSPLNPTPPTKGLHVEGGSLFKGAAMFLSSISITSGSPSNGKVLTATDNLGTATWKDLPTTSPFPNNGLPKPNYDSNWQPISAGQKIPINHNLNSSNYFIYVEGKDQNGQVHQVNLGSDNGTGLIWRNKTSTSLEVKRGANDDDNVNHKWKQFRVQIWIINPF